MTTFGTYDIDSVPAPSDIELAPRPRRYDFNGATKLLNINEEREAFHRWCGHNVNLGKAYTEDKWRLYLHVFRFVGRLLKLYQQAEDAREHQIQAEDARDEYDTQQDVAPPPW